MVCREKNRRLSLPIRINATAFRAPLAVMRAFLDDGTVGGTGRKPNFQSRCAVHPSIRQEPIAFRKVCGLGGTWESKTMIRPMCVAMALACTSTSALAETCIASHYGYNGGKTASGERMNPAAMTAAHRTRSFEIGRAHV